LAVLRKSSRLGRLAGLVVEYVILKRIYILLSLIFNLSIFKAKDALL
jgi:hypothetical protein